MEIQNKNGYERKRKLKLIKVKRHLSEEHKKKISEKLKGRKHSKERIEKIKEGMKKIKIPDEIIKVKGDKCQICKSKRKLQIHHIDGNHNNGRIGNLSVICTFCHRAIHNTGVKTRFTKERWKNHPETISRWLK